MPTAIVTGAARGIGLATARLMSEAGWHVVMVDWDGDELHNVQPALPGTTAVVADVSDPAAVQTLMADVARDHGSLAALVNNAGIADFGPIEETDFDRWRAVLDNNLNGPFLMSYAATSLLAEAGGSIVNIASISGLRASTLRVAYGTSKAALIHLTKQQAVELGEKGIRANCICPGPVRTKLAMAVHSQAIIDAYHDAIPLNRYGTETEIAQAICFLASEKASYITGQVLSVDGGFDATGVGLPALRAEHS